MKYYNIKDIEKLAKKNKLEIMKFLTLSSPKVKKRFPVCINNIRKN